MRTISITKLRALGCHTFADVRRDERLARERRALTRGRSYQISGSNPAARVMLATAREQCVEVARG